MSAIEDSTPKPAPPTITRQASQYKRGVVKICLSGDCAVIRGKPRGGPPPEVNLALSGVTAPRLARRPAANPASGDAPPASQEDEPFAWEAREFLRKKIGGKEVLFAEETVIGGRSYGNIYIPPPDFNNNNNQKVEDISIFEDVRKAMILAGLVTVRASRHPDMDALRALEEEAKTNLVGLHSEESRNSGKHVRKVLWAVEDVARLTDSSKKAPVKAVVEFVVNSTTLRLFLLPTETASEFQYVTLLLSGVRTPSARPGEEKTSKEAYEAEAKFFVESRLLQRDVDVILEGVSNNNVIGSVLHPNGNIAELLLKEGLAQCVDWSMSMVSSGADKYRSAEKEAKSKRVRVWRDWTPSAGPEIAENEKSFQGTVVEIVSADTLSIKLPNGDLKRVALASVRPPRTDSAASPKPAADAPAALPKGGAPAPRFRPLYDVPYMYEAREFLRKKLIGKKVQVVVDYIQPASGDNLPERCCCTVSIGGSNIAEALVSKGLGTVVRYRQDDDKRSSAYDSLMAAENRAEKKGLGLHSKSGPPSLKVSDVSAGDLVKAKQFLPSLQRAGRLEGLVEFVASGSRVRVFIPKETCLVNFLLSGIVCPRGARVDPSTKKPVEAEPLGEEAHRLVKDAILQRQVEIEVESMDRGGSFIGYLFINNENISETLVKQGMAKVHFTAERGNYYGKLKTAEDEAKAAKIGVWENYVEVVAKVEEKMEEEEGEGEEEEKPAGEEKSSETTTTTTTAPPSGRKANYRAIVITDLCKESLHFFCQFADDGPKLEKLMEELNEDLKANPPLPGAYSPKKDDLVAAKFGDDGLWYRARVESLVNSASGTKTASLFYIDYGNKAQVSVLSDVAPLPDQFSSSSSSRGFAHEFGLALAILPENDEDAKSEAFSALAEDLVSAEELLLNSEYGESAGVQMATLINAADKEDIGKRLIAEGLFLHDRSKMRERKLRPLNDEYAKAQEAAKEGRLNLWRYGDFLGEEAKEFGAAPPRK